MRREIIIVPTQQLSIYSATILKDTTELEAQRAIEVERTADNALGGIYEASLK